jgi:uncharacterized protein YjbI with pentapeptide repeats
MIASIWRSRLTEFTVKPPRIPASLTTWEGKTSEIREGWRESAIRLEGLDLSACLAPSIALDQVRFERVSLDSAELVKARLWDVELLKCGCAGLSFSEAAMHCVVFAGCRLSGANFSQSQLEHVRFESCKLDLANFRSARLEAVEFLDCELREADFVGSGLTNVRFECCELKSVDFDRSTMQNVDLRSSEIGELKSASGLSGATIDSVQLLGAAHMFASRLGIKVFDRT